MASENKKIVMFDFDGVIVNTLDLSFQIHKVKNKNLEWKHFQDYSNGNFHDGIGNAMKEGKSIPADDFAGEYVKGLALLTTQEMIGEAILNLSNEYTLVIISSSDTTYIADFLSKEKIEQCFSDILGADVHRSKIVKINSILDKYKIQPNHSVFITDTLGDIKEANECDVPSIGVTWGLHDRETMQKGNPKIIIEDPMDIVSAVHKILNG